MEGMWEEEPPPYHLAVQIELEEGRGLNQQNPCYADTYNAGSASNVQPSCAELAIVVDSEDSDDLGQDPPPPYSQVDPLRSDRAQAASSQLDSSGVVASNVTIQQPLAEILDNNDTFTFGRRGEIYDKCGTKVLQLPPGPNWDFQDLEGNTLLSLKNRVLSNQGRAIGYIKALGDEDKNCVLTTAKHLTDQLAFESKQMEGWGFQFLSHDGKEYGSAKGAGELFQVSWRPSLDSNTKALLLVCAAMLSQCNYEKTYWRRMPLWEKLIHVALYILIGVPAVVIVIVSVIAMELWKLMPGWTIT